MSESVRFIRVPTTVLEALLRLRLNGLQWRILSWVVRQTYGWNRATAVFSWYGIAKDIAADRGGVVRAGTKLLRSGILHVEGHEIGMEPDQTRIKHSADAGHRKAGTTNSASAATQHRQRVQKTSLFPRAKDNSKDSLKTYKNKRAGQSDAGKHRHRNSGFSDPHPAGAAQPVPGKYGSVSQD